MHVQIQIKYPLYTIVHLVEVLQKVGLTCSLLNKGTYYGYLRQYLVIQMETQFIYVVHPCHLYQLILKTKQEAEAA